MRVAGEWGGDCWHAQTLHGMLPQGLYHLVNRGLVHSKADLSPAFMGSNGAVRMGPAPLYPHQRQVRAACRRMPHAACAWALLHCVLLTMPGARSLPVRYLS